MVLGAHVGVGVGAGAAKNEQTGGGGGMSGGAKGDDDVPTDRDPSPSPQVGHLGQERTERQVLPNSLDGGDDVLLFLLASSFPEDHQDQETAVV